MNTIRNRMKEIDESLAGSTSDIQTFHATLTLRALQKKLLAVISGMKTDWKIQTDGEIWDVLEVTPDIPCYEFKILEGIDSYWDVTAFSTHIKLYSDYGGGRSLDKSSPLGKSVWDALNEALDTETELDIRFPEGPVSEKFKAGKDGYQGDDVGIMCDRADAYVAELLPGGFVLIRIYGTDVAGVLETATENGKLPEDIVQYHDSNGSYYVHERHLMPASERNKKWRDQHEDHIIMEMVRSPLTH